MNCDRLHHRDCEPPPEPEPLIVFTPDLGLEWELGLDVEIIFEPDE